MGSWFESFSVDTFACDLDHQPISKTRAYKSGDFVRICIQTISDNSDIIVTGLRYFVFSTQKTDDEENLTGLRTGKLPSFACSDDNMCVVESMLDDPLITDGIDEVKGYGSIVLRHRNSKEKEESTINIQLSLNLKPENSSDREPNLQEEGQSRHQFLRGKMEGK